MHNLSSSFCFRFIWRKRSPRLKKVGTVIFLGALPKPGGHHVHESVGSRIRHPGLRLLAYPVRQWPSDLHHSPGLRKSTNNWCESKSMHAPAGEVSSSLHVQLESRHPHRGARTMHAPRARVARPSGSASTPVTAENRVCIVVYQKSRSKSADPDSLQCARFQRRPSLSAIPFTKSAKWRIFYRAESGSKAGPTSR